MSSLVSVIITTFQRKDDFKRALDSVLCQTYRNIEIIVVDDNKDNDYSEYVKKEINKISDERIRYIKNKRNLGGALARNVGIAASKGKYVAFLDDDDIYLSNKVEKQLKFFENSKSDKLALVYCYCDGIKRGQVISKYRYDYRGNCLYDAMLTCIAATSQWMCKKICLERVDCFTDMPCKQDSYVIVKLLAAGYIVDRVPDVLSQYDEEDKVRISSKKAEKRIIGETMLRDLCRKNYEKISKKQQENVEHNFACVLAPYYFEIGDKKKTRNALRKIIKKPFRVRSIAIYEILLKKSVKRYLNRFCPCKK